MAPCMEGIDPQPQAVFGEQAETWGLLSDFRYSGNGLSVTLSQPAKGSGASLLGKEPSKTWPEWAGAEEGVQSTTDNSTLEGRPQTETKDGLLLRGACETKTMHAKKVFGKWWGRRGRTTNQKTNSGGKPVLAPPSPPLYPTPGPVSPVVKRSFLKEHQDKDISCFPKD